MSLVLALLILLAAGAVRADPVLVDGRGRVDLTFDGVLNDPGSRRTIADVRGNSRAFANSAPWSGRASLGFTDDAVWLRSEILVAPAAAGLHVLMLDIPNFERLEMWGSWTEARVAAIGDLAMGASPAWRHAEAVELPAGRHTLWFRAVTSGPIAVPLALWQPDALVAAEQRAIHVHTMLTAVVVLLGLGALLLAAMLPSLAMLLYAGSALASAAHIMAMNGLDRLLWGGPLPIGTNNPFVWLVVSGLFGIAFLFSVLPLRRSRWVPPVVGAPIALGLLLLTLYSLFLEGDYRLNLLGPRNLALLILAAGVAASVQSRLAGHRPASYMILGWLALAAGNVVAALRNAGVLPFTDVTYVLPVYAPLVEMLLFAAMLAAQLRLLRVEKEEAQRALVVALRRNEEELAMRVAARTADLDRANDLLGAREAQLRLILEAAPMPIVVFQATAASPLYTNRRMRELLTGDGNGEAGAVPDIRTIYQNPGDGDRLAAALERDGFVDNAEVAMRDGAGKPFWALASMVAIDYRGQPASLLAINDISRRRQLEQELVKAKEMAETAAGLERAARDAQRQFLAMISHEFRTPLAVISTATQYLQLEAEVDPAREPRLARIRRAIDHMNGMIDACLLDDRIEGAGLLLRTSLLHPAVLLCKAVDTAKAAAPRHVFTTVTENLPMTAGDEQLLGMALSNLMENAVKYSPPGSAVEVTLKRSGDEAVITVADRGPGVPAGECDRVFEKYYRCANVGRVPGAGLGLYLTRHIVTAHGGTVGVRNRAGGGALFTIHLPLPGVVDPDYGATPASEAGPAWSGTA